MDIYYLIFINSLQSTLILSPHAETGWFSALLFGGYDMAIATAAALAGSLIGAGIDYSIGYGISLARRKWFPAREEASYSRFVKYICRYFVIVLLLPGLPFLSFLVMFAGMLRVSPLVTGAIVMLGRIAYYGYYLQS